MKLKRNQRKVHNVLSVQDLAISTALVEERFHCDLSKCKGACCVEGDLGAPLEKPELKILDQVYEEVEPYLTEKGKEAIKEQGNYVLDFSNSYSTPLINGKECAYTTFDDKGIAFCGIEQAHLDGKIAFKKPISCHLYPIRIHKNRYLEALNYDEWKICSPACNLGEKKGIRVYEFVKDALIRKYGEEFYDELDAVSKAWINSQENESRS